MTDTALRQEAIKALSDLSSALTLVTRKLGNSKGLPEAQAIPADRLRSDLIAYSQALTQQATRLGVACKPPISGKAGWEAVKGVTAALTDVATKCAFAAGKLGSTFLAKELRWTSTDVLEAIQTLATALASSLQQSASPSAHDRERHLALIGIVWSKTELLSRCSLNEAEALSRALANEVDIMEDGLVECRDLLDATGSINSDRESDEDEESLTELERRRVENAIRLLLSAKRLVKRIITLLQRSPLPLAEGKPADLARVHSTVSSLVASQDDLISTLPGPQDVEELRTFASAVLNGAQSLAELAIELWPPDPGRPDVDALISELTLDDRGSDRSVSFGTIENQLAAIGKELDI